MTSEAKYISLGGAALVGLGVVLRYLPGDAVSTEAALNKLKIATGFTLLGLIFLFGLAILVYIANGKIDLSGLLCEPGSDKGASLSRLQLLIFTLVISLSLFLVIAANMKFPDTIPPEILTLLGISASTYAVSKGIQASTTPKPDQTAGNGTPDTDPDADKGKAKTAAGGQ